MPKMSHLACTLMRELSVPVFSAIACLAIVITYSYRTYESISDSKGQAKNSREKADILKGADKVVHGHHRLLVKDRANYFLCRAKMKISTNPKIPCILVHWRPRVIYRFELNYLVCFCQTPQFPGRQRRSKFSKCSLACLQPRSEWSPIRTSPVSRHNGLGKPH